MGNICEIILNLDKRFRGCCFEIFLIWSSLDPLRLLFSGVEQFVHFY